MEKTRKLSRKDYHIFTVHGDKIMALASGEIFLIDELAEEIIRINPETEAGAMEALKERFKPDSIKKAYGEMEYILSHPIKDHRNDEPPRALRAMCLNITHKCNLACTYCFAERLTQENAVSMTSEVVRKSFDFLFEKSQDVYRLQVDFFGGEPLLVFDRVKEGVEYARSLEKKHGKMVLFTLTTNATLLTDEIIDFVRDNNISLILSLDGDRKTHNFHRRYHSGKGSFDVVLNNIEKVRQKLDRKDYYIRGTFTSGTTDVLSTLKFFNSRGYYNVSLEPVSSPEVTDYSLDREDLDELLTGYLDAAQWMLDKEMSFYHFNLEMDNPLCLTRRITGCGAGVEYVAVDPRGDLYPCHQFIEDNRFKIGSVYTGLDNHDVIDEFRRSTLYEKEQCGECWARFYCGGGCHYQQFSETGSIKKPSPFYCKLFRKRLEIALWHNVKKKLLSV